MRRYGRGCRGLRECELGLGKPAWVDCQLYFGGRGCWALAVGEVIAEGVHFGERMLVAGAVGGGDTLVEAG